MPLAGFSLPYPVALANQSVMNVSAGNVNLNTTTPTGAVAIGSLLKISGDDANSYDAVASTDDSVAYVVAGIFTPNGHPVNEGYVSTTDLATGVYTAMVYAVGPNGRQWGMTEDADGGKITDAHIGGYFDIVVGTPSLPPDTQVDPYAKAQANILIDSSSYNASSSGLCVQVLARYPAAGVPGYTSSLPSTFVVTFVNPQASLS